MSNTFKRIPSKDMPPDMFRHHILTVITVGVVLLVCACALAWTVNTESGFHDAQQRAVAVQRGLSNIGEQETGLGHVFPDITATGFLSDAQQKQVTALAGEEGSVRDVEYDAKLAQATHFIYDDGLYVVTFDRGNNPAWIVSNSHIPFITRSY